MSSLYETDGNRIFSSGRKSLKDLDIRTLPELNPEYPKQYFRKIRKAMFQQIQEQRGRTKILPKSSVDYVQRFQSGPRALFVTEYDKVWPDEPEPVVGEKKKKAKDPEPKYYAHHKYQFASVKSNPNAAPLDSAIDLTKDPSSDEPITLSYFTRPNTTITTQNLQSAKEKKAAMDLIMQKKAHLQALFGAADSGVAPVQGAEPQGDDDDEEEEEEHGAEEEEDDAADEEADGVDPLAPSESKDDLVFDLHPDLPE